MIDVVQASGSPPGPPRRTNCDFFARGFHLDRPLPVEVAATFLASNP